MFFFIFRIFSFLAGFFKILKPDPLECIANLLNGKNFVVFEQIDIASNLGKFVSIDYPNPLHGRNFYHLIIKVNDDDGPTSYFPLKLNDLKKFNQRSEFAPIFNGIDKILIANPNLKFC